MIAKFTQFNSDCGEDVASVENKFASPTGLTQRDYLLRSGIEYRANRGFFLAQCLMPHTQPKPLIFRLPYVSPNIESSYP